jgi:hypothetical protein
MSLQATAWAIEFQDLPLDARTGRISSSAKLVLVALANHADRDGSDCFPAVSTVMDYTGLSERSIQYALRALEDHGTIAKTADPLVRSSTIGRVDRRPQSYDLVAFMRGAKSVAHGVQSRRPRGAKSAPDSPDTGCKVVGEFAPEPVLNQKNNCNQEKQPATNTAAAASAEAAQPADDGQGTLFASWQGLFPDNPANDPASTDASADKPDPNAGGPPDAPTRASHQNSAGADRVTAQTVVAAWVDAYRGARGDVRPTRGQIGQASRAAKECLAAGNDPARVMAAAEAAGRAGYPTIERQLAMMTAPPGGGRHAPTYRDDHIPDDAYAEAIR